MSFQCPFGFNCTKKDQGCRNVHYDICKFYLSGSCRESNGDGCTRGSHPKRLPDDMFELTDGTVVAYKGFDDRRSYTGTEEKKVSKYDKNKERNQERNEVLGKNGKKLPPYLRKQQEKEEREARKLKKLEKKLGKKSGSMGGNTSDAPGWVPEPRRKPSEQVEKFPGDYIATRPPIMRFSQIGENKNYNVNGSGNNGTTIPIVGLDETKLQAAIADAVGGNTAALLAQQKLASRVVEKYNMQLQLIQRTLNMVESYGKEADAAKAAADKADIDYIVSKFTPVNNVNSTPAVLAVVDVKSEVDSSTSTTPRQV
jgi:hypothetical protein